MTASVGLDWRVVDYLIQCVYCGRLHHYKLDQPVPICRCQDRHQKMATATIIKPASTKIS
jgi:hypothetical protein